MRDYNEYYSNLYNKLIEYENIMVLGAIVSGALISGLSITGLFYLGLYI